jgi:predicted nucleic acid-binding protein
MIILDTDVLSDLMRQARDPAVVGWLDRQSRFSVWSTSITVLEIRFGIALLPLGARRTQLERAFERTVEEKIEERIVPFDTIAAEATAILMAEPRQRGSSGELRDSMIAGIIIAHRATLATRNARHFADLPVPVVNPWAN